MSKTILVATDFGDSSEHAIRYALELAHKLDATVHLVHAWVIPTFATDDLAATVSSELVDQLQKAAQRAMDAAVTRHSTPGSPVTGTVCDGRIPAQPSSSSLRR